jgi:hypothetical protein
VFGWPAYGATTSEPDAQIPGSFWGTLAHQAGSFAWGALALSLPQAVRGKARFGIEANALLGRAGEEPAREQGSRAGRGQAQARF